MVPAIGPNGSAIDPGRSRACHSRKSRGDCWHPPALKQLPADINAMIERADWIIFAMLNVNTDEDLLIQ